ncbi:hypothetical protein BDV93DRAFT_552692 [Ceratobasidium sp. AG-I]|nr:hypothetical protein BDV93DRAFT_552692 [Ceratobasidium sp. AG-I]
MGIASDDDEPGWPGPGQLALRDGAIGPNPGEQVLRPATPPVVPRRRRTRLADSSDDELLSEQQKKRRVDFANKLCDQIGVTPLQRAQVSGYSLLSTHDMILSIYAHGLAPKSALPGDSTDFAKSRVFKEYIAPRLHASILDANLESYVTGLTESFVKHIRRNFQSYHLERSDLAEYAFSKSCNAAVSSAFTAYRAELKKKFFESIDSEIDIGTLAQSFTMENYQMTTEHWARYAVIRSYVLDYQSDLKNGKKPGSFWTYIDKKLAKVRQGLAKFPESERAGRLQTKLDAALSADQQKYPFIPDENDITSRPAVVVAARFADVPDWQLACETALLEMQDHPSGPTDAENVDAAPQAAAEPAPGEEQPDGSNPDE